MKRSIYELALKCKSISEEKIGTDRTLIPYSKVVFTDYTDRSQIRGRFFDPFCRKTRGQELSYSKSESEVDCK